MTEIGAFEAKNTLGGLLNRVSLGEEFVITRHGKPVARLVPMTAGIDHAQAKAAAGRIRDRAQSGRTEFDWDALTADRDSGRP